MSAPRRALIVWLVFVAACACGRDPRPLHRRHVGVPARGGDPDAAVAGRRAPRGRRVAPAADRDRGRARRTSSPRSAGRWRSGCKDDPNSPTSPTATPPSGRPIATSSSRTGTSSARASRREASTATLWRRHSIAATRRSRRPRGRSCGAICPADPTGELAAHPRRARGHRAPGDASRRLDVVRPAHGARARADRGAGFRSRPQQANVAVIAEAFAAARDETKRRSGDARRDSGPAVFAVRSREVIRRDVERLSAMATVDRGRLLLLAFRSPRVLGLAFVPVATGALAGVAAVALAFGTVHGITLGFGVVLIGEAIDYAIYFFAQRTPSETAGALLRCGSGRPCGSAWRFPRRASARCCSRDSPASRSSVSSPWRGSSWRR